MPDRPPSGAPDLRTDADSPNTDPNLEIVLPGDDTAGGPAITPAVDLDPLESTSPLKSVAERQPDPARASPRRTTVHPGVLLDGRYQLQRHISDRGPIQLWLGEDQVLARAVAIRLLIDDGSAPTLEAIHHLLDSARRSGGLVHNGAASTYDATTTDADGLPLAYVVSEWVAGISLLDLLRDAPLQPERAAAVQLSVARVVAAAHAVGVTHGDLHPGDVIITSHGLVKVLDLEMRAALGKRAPQQDRARDVTGIGRFLRQPHRQMATRPRSGATGRRGGQQRGVPLASSAARRRTARPRCPGDVRSRAGRRYQRPRPRSAVRRAGRRRTPADLRRTPDRVAARPRRRSRGQYARRPGSPGCPGRAVGASECRPAQDDATTRTPRGAPGAPRSRCVAGRRCRRAPPEPFRQDAGDCRQPDRGPHHRAPDAGPGHRLRSLSG